jgi:hypothetical protein
MQADIPKEAAKISVRRQNRGSVEPQDCTILGVDKTEPEQRREQICVRLFGPL